MSGRNYIVPLMLSGLVHIVAIGIALVLIGSTDQAMSGNEPLRITILNASQSVKIQGSILKDIKSVIKNMPLKKIVDIQDTKKTKLKVVSQHSVSSVAMFSKSHKPLKELTALGAISVANHKDSKFIYEEMSVSTLSKLVTGKEGNSMLENYTVPASIHQKEKPNYPAISRRKGEEGRVVLTVEIGPDGDIGEVSIIKTSGYSRLDMAAIKAAKKSTYNPAIVENIPVRDKKKIAITFKLDD